MVQQIQLSMQTVACKRVQLGIALMLHAKLCFLYTGSEPVIAKPHIKILCIHRLRAWIRKHKGDYWRVNIYSSLFASPENGGIGKVDCTLMNIGIPIVQYPISHNRLWALLLFPWTNCLIMLEQSVSVGILTRLVGSV